MITNIYDSVVVGGGLIGMMTAHELCSAGQKVAILESKTVGSESSWAGGGILSPLYPWRETAALSDLTRWSQQYYPVLANQLCEATGIDPEWERSGMKILSTEEQDKALDWATNHNVSVELINNDALWLPDVAQIRNPLLISALKKHLEQTGVEIHEYTTVEKIRICDYQVKAIETTQGEFTAAVTVIANGAWGAELMPELDIRPVRGQMICYQASPGFVSHIIMKNGIYIIPRRDGHILVGSTVEEVGFDKGISEQARMQLSESAEVMLPGINRFPVVGHWSGLRPATRGNTPYISRHPEVEGLYLNIGHHRNGILHAPGSARLMVDIILKRDTMVPADVFQFRSQTCVNA
jgi:glycine oxidase